jgi:hypothetical protein
VGDHVGGIGRYSVKHRMVEQIEWPPVEGENRDVAAGRGTGPDY